MHAKMLLTGRPIGRLLPIECQKGHCPGRWTGFGQDQLRHNSRQSMAMVLPLGSPLPPPKVVSRDILTNNVIRRASMGDKDARDVEYNMA